MDTATKPPIFPVTGAQLHDIFGGTNTSRCEEVAKLINKYSTEYGIDNAEKMSHFVGQIGAETLLNNLDEDSYTKNGILISPKTTTLRNHNGNKVLKYCSPLARASRSCQQSMSNKIYIICKIVKQKT